MDFGGSIIVFSSEIIYNVIVGQMIIISAPMIRSVTSAVLMKSLRIAQIYHLLFLSALP